MFLYLQYRNRNFRFRIQTSNNETFVAYVDNSQASYDNIGALYYVVAVVLIYGLSIVMMIASHIRRNNQDSQLRSYLKEMAALRKKNRREKLLEKMTDLAVKSNKFTNSKTMESSFTETRKLVYGNDTSVYGRLPTETDDELRENLLIKNSNSNSDNDDSVFQLPNEYCIEAPTQVESPLSPKYSPSKLTTPKGFRSETKAFFQVINENAPL